jgi:dephospho-CoA kinase
MAEDKVTGWVALTGKIGVGKTTVARCLVARSGAAYVAFGEYVRAEAQLRDVQLTRRALQDLGDALIAEHGPRVFVRHALRHAQVEPGSPLVVVDGVRSQAIASLLGEFAAPAPLRLTYIEIPEELRLERVSHRRQAGDELAAGDRHPSEREVTTLRELADDIVSGQDSGAICDELVRRLARRD